MQHKILLAEDDNDMRRFLVKALENAGFQVSSYDNGLSAYQRLRTMTLQKTPAFPANVCCPDNYIGSGEHNAAIKNGEDEEKRRQ